jgi:hypothetical protein
VHGITGARAGVWEIGRFAGPMVIGRRNERPRFPQIALAADAESGLAFAPVLREFTEEPGAVVVEALLAAIESRGAVPGRLHVASPAAKACLVPIAGMLDIKIVVRDRLPVVDDFREAIQSGLPRGPALKQ